jgi:hypothetical protein
VPRKQELCGANLYESSDKRKSANPAVTCSMSGVHCPVELTKVRQSMHRQAVLVFFARDVHFIKCLESRSRAPLASERFARVPSRLSARSTGRMFIGRNSSGFVYRSKEAPVGQSGSTPGTGKADPGALGAGVLSQTKKRKDYADDYNETDNIDNSVHNLFLSLSAASRPRIFPTAYFIRSRDQITRS